MNPQKHNRLEEFCIGIPASEVQLPVVLQLKKKKTLNAKIFQSTRWIVLKFSARPLNLTYYKILWLQVPQKFFSEKFGTSTRKGSFGAFSM